MAKTKTFGRADDNDVTLPSQYIGRHHAKITLQDDNTFLVEDLESLSGTFVNGRKIQRVTITLKDKVELADTTIDLRAIFQVQAPGGGPKAKTDPNDFVEEFQLLKKVQERYRAERNEINRSYQQKAKRKRATWMIAPIPVCVLAQYFYPTMPIYLVTMSISAMGVFMTDNIPPQDELDKLNDAHQATFVCPRQACSTYLGHMNWQSYYNQGKCHKCGAKYK